MELVDKTNQIIDHLNSQDQELAKAREEVLLEIKKKFCGGLVVDFNKKGEMIGKTPDIDKWVEKKLSKLKTKE